MNEPPGNNTAPTAPPPHTPPAGNATAPGVQLDGRGAIATDGSAAVGGQGVWVDGDNRGDVTTGDRRISAAPGGTVIYAEKGATVFIGDAPVPMPAVDQRSALGRYLQHLISQHRTLQLQGIRSGGKLVNIELDRIYVTLRTTRQPTQRQTVDWLTDETALAPGEGCRGDDPTLAGRSADEARRETTQISVNQALAEHRRLVVLGDPGCGKTTLLRYLTLLYARDLADATRQVADRLELDESGVLPIFLPLRQIGRYLAEHRPRDDGTEGHAILLHFLRELLHNERIAIPDDFFDPWLAEGRAALLLDGLDEVADPALRRRVARLVDALTRAHPRGRFVVTSRLVGYTDASQLAEGYATTTVRDFTLDDIRQFLTHWHRLVAIGQMGPGETAEAFAGRQTGQLLAAIENSERVRELAINPLLLTVIALIHRDRVKLPDRRAELYQEAVDVLLGKWDEAKGVEEALRLDDRPLDSVDRRLILQSLALAMHEQALKEIDVAPLRALLTEELANHVADPRQIDAAVGRFLQVIQERAGLLIARGEGSYAFSHLTFQEYLAALAIAGREDYVDYTLRRSGDAWWREVILLEAGHLGTQDKKKTTRLIRAIADARAEPQPYHNLILAAECLRDTGANRVVGDLGGELRGRLQRELDRPAAVGFFGGIKALLRGTTPGAATQRRIAAAEALGVIGGSRYWRPPHGDPEWVAIPAGEFTMGEAEAAHRVRLPAYAIARVPVSNAQYALFVQATGYDPPEYWNGKRPPRNREAHPVVEVSWHDALAYCRWLSEATRRPIGLPSEAEWEKAARGDADARAYPWGDVFDAARCNVGGSGFDGTTPVGVFAHGASPYGCLDMAGNVWEWTRSLWGKDPQKPTFVYPYAASDPKREDLNAPDDVYRVVRGGSWYFLRGFARCAYRYGFRPGFRYVFLGFRVVLRSSPVL
ncbi:SUMF1/EgtB/PvdO family nonheme iron enzyme [Accumulibacter sp.]|uniref:SUMF1/EgtB/PvdO family nonheme iron enzyme n=1 Tax=Accumulibacter sp. TaxID=2053492 RepID=UPI00262FDB79|nr:SUMF1/EgtB/PvdO family nonheme iron enzyme [Accumulibacter sp.]